MNIGGLDRRVEIQNRTLSVNSYGEHAETWNTYATVWAQIERKPAAVEKNIGEQMVSENKVVFNIRYSSTTKAIDATYRISYESNYYNILGAHEVGRQDQIRLITELVE